MSSTANSKEMLQARWAGGQDVWPQVPDDDGPCSIITRVKEEQGEKETDEIDSKSHAWPRIVQESVCLYGFGAYNPRGQTVANEINVRQHEALKKDIIMRQLSSPTVVIWEAASQWEDGSTESGFIVAIRNNKKKDTHLEQNAEDQSSPSSIEAWVIALATKYEQGAIYKFAFSSSKGNIGNKLIRSTIPVLDPGTEADVEVIIASKKQQL